MKCLVASLLSQISVNMFQHEKRDSDNDAPRQSTRVSRPLLAPLQSLFALLDLRKPCLKFGLIILQCSAYPKSGQMTTTKSHHWRTPQGEEGELRDAHHALCVVHLHLVALFHIAERFEIHCLLTCASPMVRDGYFTLAVQVWVKAGGVMWHLEGCG